LNSNRPTQPGEHVVEVSAQGYKTATARVSLPEGGNDSIALTLEVDPNAAKPEPVTTAPSMNANASMPPATHPEVSTEPTSRPNRVPAYAALGVGVVGIGVGSIFGLMAIGKKGSVQDACDGAKCPSSVQDDIDAGKTFGVVSTVGFIVGAVGLVAGTYLYLTNTPKTGWDPNRQRAFVGANGLKLTF
jgi:hypothetical protein